MQYGYLPGEATTPFSEPGSDFACSNFFICHSFPYLLQLRLDFSTFTIAMPSSNTLTATKILNGLPQTGGQAAVPHGDCNTDAFTVTNPGGHSPPTICGTNTGEHSKLEEKNIKSDDLF